MVVLSLLLVFSSCRHGTERITIKPKDDDKMQFKTFTPNETESMFQTTTNKEDMNITMQEANISMSGYVSQEVKDQ